MSTVHLVFGPQGAGKSTYAATLTEAHGAVSFSIDAWMAELFGPDLPQTNLMPWVMQRVARCEARIWHSAQAVALRGVTVVLDLGFMKAASRQRFSELAEQAGLQVQRHYIHADMSTRRERVAARNSERGATFAFEVTPVMFAAMEGQFEVPDNNELIGAITLRT